MLGKKEGGMLFYLHVIVRKEQHIYPSTYLINSLSLERWFNDGPDCIRPTD